MNGDTLLEAIGLLAPFGRAVVYGAADARWLSIPLLGLAALKTVSGFSLLTWRAAAPEQARADLRELTGLLRSGELRVAAKTLPFTAIAEAQTLYADRAVLGRLVLTP